VSKQASNGLLNRLTQARRFKKLLPNPVKALLRRFLPAAAYRRAWLRAQELSLGIEEASSYPAKVDVTLGIIKDYYCVHKFIVYACRDMGVPYRLIDIYRSDWMEAIGSCGCAAFLVMPRIYTTTWRLMYDEKLRAITEELGAIVYPSYNELWLYESKRRMNYWLKTHGFEHPKTLVFYSYDDAMEFAHSTKLPIVAKTELGYGAKGVRIFRNRSDIIKYVKKCFNKGLLTNNEGIKNMEWGFSIFQEYIPKAKEWRMVRIGKSYFGHLKLKKGQFHSGSGDVSWYDPPCKLLNLARNLTSCGGFTSMNLDIFETEDGHYLVNELQSLFGSKRPYQMLLNGKAGRYLFDDNSKAWHFEEGDFCRNLCWNLRVQTLLEMLGHHVALPEGNPDTIVDEEDRKASIRDFSIQKSQQLR
jgi:hypothetical protein